MAILNTPVFALWQEERILREENILLKFPLFHVGHNRGVTCPVASPETPFLQLWRARPLVCSNSKENMVCLVTGTRRLTRGSYVRMDFFILWRQLGTPDHSKWTEIVLTISIPLHCCSHTKLDFQQGKSKQSANKLGQPASLPVDRWHSCPQTDNYIEKTMAHNVITQTSL